MVFARVQMMAMRDLGVVSGFLVIPGLVMLSRLSMVLCRLLVVVCGLFMMLVFRHFLAPGLFLRKWKIAMIGDTFATEAAVAVPSQDLLIGGALGCTRNLRYLARLRQR